MTYTDTQLKQALVKMLPEQLSWQMFDEDEIPRDELCWGHKAYHWPVLDTELLHLCWLVEQTLTEKEDVWFLQKLSQKRYEQGEGGTIGTLIDRSVHATWQQRVITLAIVKGVDIV